MLSARGPDGAVASLACSSHALCIWPHLLSPALRPQHPATALHQVDLARRQKSPVVTPGSARSGRLPWGASAPRRAGQPSTSGWAFWERPWGGCGWTTAPSAPFSRARPCCLQASWVWTATLTKMWVTPCLPRGDLCAVASDQGGSGVRCTPCCVCVAGPCVVQETVLVCDRDGVAIAAGIAEHPSDVLRMLSGKLASSLSLHPA